jgi:transcription elongation factor GreA
MTDYVPMTREGYDKLKAELDKMESVDMPQILERLANARSEGDLRENAEYHGQREAQGMLQARINERRSILSRAEIIDPSTIDQSKISLGATIVVKDLDTDEDEELSLVGKGEDDIFENKFLVTSPIGQGLLGKKAGEKVEIQVPRGKLRYKILEIKYGS